MTEVRQHVLRGRGDIVLSGIETERCGSMPALFCRPHESTVISADAAKRPRDRFANQHLI
jgi:hypothetical protein